MRSPVLNGMEGFGCSGAALSEVVLAFAFFSDGLLAADERLGEALVPDVSEDRKGELLPRPIRVLYSSIRRLISANSFS